MEKSDRPNEVMEFAHDSENHGNKFGGSLVRKILYAMQDHDHDHENDYNHNRVESEYNILTEFILQV